ncbi:CmcJ/NvfI family oxidoreductase [Roseobacteraceae bacterium S113]
MTRTATVNYHVHKTARQAFELDAGGVVGNLISPELARTKVQVADVRTEGSGAFADTSVGFRRLVSQVKDFADTQDWQSTYDEEVSQFLKRELDAEEVIVFDHTVRIDDPEADRKPARNVHSDYSQSGAEKRLIDLVGSQNAKAWAQGHYAFINIWRPVETPINSAPLGFILPDSVADADWITLDLIYPDRIGQIMGLADNPRHRWVYMSKMTPDEVAFFNIYDNRGLPSIAHSALDMTEDPTIHTIRKSIESRTLVRY